MALNSAFRAVLAYQPSDYETVAASQTAQALGATGAAGDFIAGILVIPAVVACGVVTLLDGATSIPVFVGGGTTALPSCIPFYVPLNLKSVGGAWKITTGANVSCVAGGGLHLMSDTYTFGNPAAMGDAPAAGGNGTAVVSGAGTAAADGIYAPTGTHNGKPYYNKAGSDPETSAISWDGGWTIYGSGSEGYYNNQSEDVAFPWLSAAWSEVNGDVPPPTVTEGS